MQALSKKSIIECRKYGKKLLDQFDKKIGVNEEPDKSKTNDNDKMEVDKSCPDKFESLDKNPIITSILYDIKLIKQKLNHLEMSLAMIQSLNTNPNQLLYNIQQQQ